MHSFNFFPFLLLVEAHIAYKDIHVGNIMPNSSPEKGLQVIDFDLASLWNDCQAAKSEVLTSAYFQVLFQKYMKLSLSEKSKELIR